MYLHESLSTYYWFVEIHVVFGILNGSSIANKAICDIHRIVDKMEGFRYWVLSYISDMSILFKVFPNIFYTYIISHKLEIRTLSPMPCTKKVEFLTLQLASVQHACDEIPRAKNGSRRKEVKLHHFQT